MNGWQPLVSVVMPNYNTPEEYLRGAIESVLNQTYQNLELIIVDDASGKNDVAVIRSYSDKRILLLQNEENRHVAYTVNRGIAAARGEYIARMDSDDICLPHRLEQQIRFMQRHPDIDILYARARMFGSQKALMAPGIKNAAHMKAEIFFGCPVIHPTVMFKASFLKLHGLFYSTAPEYKAAEDYELWSRCVEKGNIAELPQVLLKYRVHPKQITASARSRQYESAGRVRCNMLGWLNIAPDEDEKTTHCDFCVTRPTKDLKKTEAWARRLIEGNDKQGVFEKKYFKKLVLRNFLVIAVKSAMNKEVGFKEMIKNTMMRQALFPGYYPVYLKRFLLSMRLNRYGR